MFRYIGRKSLPLALHLTIPRILSCILLVLTGLLGASASVAAATTLTGKADIVDGDTVKVGGIPVRLYGIDAPEGRQNCEREGKTYACGKEATKELATLIAGQTIQCEIVGKDQYARALGVCTVGAIEINRTMVREGWALAFVKYSDRYSADQAMAEAAKAGIWAGSFVEPWDWRLAEVKAAEKTLGAEKRGGCVIKGNINRNGEHIYHLPFQQFYSRTKIDESKGERWFCTEQQAQEAGWRRALR
jgi:endonuclease YncB( thermonuclease family)